MGRTTRSGASAKEKPKINGEAKKATPKGKAKRLQSEKTTSSPLTKEKVEKSLPSTSKDWTDKKVAKVKMTLIIIMHQYIYDWDSFLPLSRVKTIGMKERLDGTKKLASFVIAALFHSLHRRVKSAVI